MKIKILLLSLFVTSLQAMDKSASAAAAAQQQAPAKEQKNIQAQEPITYLNLNNIDKFHISKDHLVTQHNSGKIKVVNLSNGKYLCLKSLSKHKEYKLLAVSGDKIITEVLKSENRPCCGLIGILDINTGNYLYGLGTCNDYITAYTVIDGKIFIGTTNDKYSTFAIEVWDFNKKLYLANLVLKESSSPIHKIVVNGNKVLGVTVNQVFIWETDFQ